MQMRGSPPIGTGPILTLRRSSTPCDAPGQPQTKNPEFVRFDTSESFCGVYFSQTEVVPNIIRLKSDSGYIIVWSLTVRLAVRRFSKVRSSVWDLTQGLILSRGGDTPSISLASHRALLNDLGLEMTSVQML